MPLKNYTTTIAPEKTVTEIEAILSSHGATDIYKQYDGMGNITTISFAVETEYGHLAFRLPARPEAVRQIISDQKKRGEIRISKKLAEDMSHARKVTWRIIKDWIDAQIALIEVDIVKLEEVFLPYMLSSKDGKTLYQILEEGKFRTMLPRGEER